MFFLMLGVILVGAILDINALTDSYGRRPRNAPPEMSKKERRIWAWSIILVGIVGMVFSMLATSHAYENDVLISSGELETTEAVQVRGSTFTLDDNGQFDFANDYRSNDDIEVTTVIIDADETPHYEVLGDISHHEWVYGVGGKSEIVEEYIFYVHG